MNSQGLPSWLGHLADLPGTYADPKLVNHTARQQVRHKIAETLNRRFENLEDRIAAWKNIIPDSIDAQDPITPGLEAKNAIPEEDRPELKVMGRWGKRSGTGYEQARAQAQRLIDEASQPVTIPEWSRKAMATSPGPGIPAPSTNSNTIRW